MLFPIFCLSKGRGGITASYPSAYFITDRHTIVTNKFPQSPLQFISSQRVTLLILTELIATAGLPNY